MIEPNTRLSGVWKKSTGSIPFPAVKRILVVTAAIAIVLGLSITSYWVFKAQKLEARDFVLQNWPKLLIGLASVSFLTLLHGWLRWLRWHFLIRRVGAKVATKDSLLIYLATSPALITPFFIGELFRVVMLGRKYSRYRFDVAAIWLMERCSDLLMLCLFLSIISGEYIYLILSGLLWLFAFINIKLLYRYIRRYDFPNVEAIAALLFGSLIFGLFPGVSLWLIETLLGSGLGILKILEISTRSSIVGHLTGLPSGMGVSGSTVVISLQENGTGLLRAAFSALLYRMGTVWFAITLGLIALLAFRSRLLSVFRSGQRVSHFDQLSDTYDEELPAWIRDRLLVRKTGAMQKWLDPGSKTNPIQGLDIGCGQGWHTCEMAKLGYHMYGIDQSEQQVKNAIINSTSRDLQIEFHCSNASKLPFKDNYFDFVYSINVFHHLTDSHLQQITLKEVVRVLKPNGVFFLHEMNTINPIFRFYMGYLYPLIRGIDEGTEKWIRPNQLPAVSGARWSDQIDYFTFLPDFIPSKVLNLLKSFEHHLERSRFRKYSAHYLARLVKDIQHPDHDSH